MREVFPSIEYVEGDLILMVNVYYLFYVLYRYLSAYLLADFITGVGHWVEDTYFDENFKLFSFLGSYGKKADEFIIQIIKDNREHHLYPGKFDPSWFNNVTSTLPFALFGFTVNFIINYFFGWPFDMSNVFMWAFICSVNAIHRSQHLHMIEHEGRIERPVIFSVLQHIGFLQSREQHRSHHGFNKNKNHNICYCILTPYLNIFLDSYGFWRTLETIIEKVTGVPPRAFETKEKKEKDKDEQDYQQVVHSLEKSRGKTE